MSAAAVRSAGDAVVVEDLWLYYPMLVRRRQNSAVRLRCLMLDLLGKRTTSEESPEGDFFPALRGVSFSLKKGEIVGLLGPNGAGKSTLLRVLAGVERADRGRVRIEGSVGSLLSLGVGIKPQLSGRENILLASRLHGIPRDRVEGYMREVIDLCDIGPFVDAPVESYSSGMRARLGFAVATRFEPDVLLLDEVIGAGDAAFKARTGNLLEHLRDTNRTVVVATHSDDFILSNCDRAIFLKKGRIEVFAEAEEALAAYREFSREQVERHQQARAPVVETGEPEPEPETVKDEPVQEKIGEAAADPWVEGEEQLGTIRKLVPLREWRRASAAWRVGFVLGAGERDQMLAAFVGRRIDDRGVSGIAAGVGDLASRELSESSSVLVVPEVRAVDPEAAEHLKRFAASGGVLVLGPDTARRPVEMNAHTEDVIDYGLGVLGDADPASAFVRAWFRAPRVAHPSGVLEGLESMDLGRPDSNAITGSVLRARPGAYTLATADVLERESRQPIGAAGVLVACRFGEGLVIRCGLDLDPRVGLVAGLIERLLDAEIGAYLRTAPLDGIGAPAVAPAVRIRSGTPPLGVRVRVSPVAIGDGGAGLATGDALAERVRRAASLGADEIVLTVKDGSALVEGIGIETYPWVDASRDVLREAESIGAELGVRVTPGVNCFEEHWPGEPARPTAFIEGNPEALHATRRQADAGLNTLDAFVAAGERLVASAHLHAGRERLERVVRSLSERGVEAVHLESFRFGNDEGGFLEPELSAKRAARSIRPGATDADISRRHLATLLTRLREVAGGVRLGVEVMHGFGLDADVLSGGVAIRKRPPVTVLRTLLERHLRDVREAGLEDRFELLVDARYRTGREIAERLTIARAVGFRRVFIEDAGVVSAMPEGEAVHLRDAIGAGTRASSPRGVATA
ncbi:MAG: ABC transporter ATP-binding protein [Phycisphaerales bacterium]